MLKHRGFPGRLPGTDFQFTIRRPNPRGVVIGAARKNRPAALFERPHGLVQVPGSEISAHAASHLVRSGVARVRSFVYQ